jgi:spermidine/putrescine transport system substrate-binding protein
MADRDPMPDRFRGAPLSRRDVLKKSAMVALALPMAGSILDACGTTNSTSSGAKKLTIATPQNPVTWPISKSNAPIADGLTPEQGGTLQLYNYADYIDPAALKSFEKKYAKYNVKVQVSTFNSTDEALAKLRSGESNFDIYFPSYDQIGKLVTADLVRPLNHSYIPHISNIWPNFTNPFYDQEWRYSIPYTVYTTGIGWRTDKAEDVSALSNPYDVFWDSKYAGKISILDDYREAMCMVLLRNGITDLSTGDPKHLKTVSDQLTAMSKATQPRVDVSDYEELPKGLVVVCQAWSGDIMNAISYLPSGTSPDVLRYWFPTDGKGAVNNDLMMVLKSGKCPVLAHLFLNYMLQPDIALGNFQAIGYQPPQNSIVPDDLVKQGIVPKTLTPMIVRPSDFLQGYRETELPPAVDAEWHAVWQKFKAGG